MGEKCPECGGPANSAPETAPAVKVSCTVTIEMTEAQHDAYEERFGVGFVGPEITSRLRPELSEALMVGLPGTRWLRWLSQHATVTISKPEISR